MEQNLTGRTNGEHCQENFGGIKKRQKVRKWNGNCSAKYCMYYRAGERQVYLPNDAEPGGKLLGGRGELSSIPTS